MDNYQAPSNGSWTLARPQSSGRVVVGFNTVFRARCRRQRVLAPSGVKKRTKKKKKKGRRARRLGDAADHAALGRWASLACPPLVCLTRTTRSRYINWSGPDEYTCKWWSITRWGRLMRPLFRHHQRDGILLISTRRTIAAAMRLVFGNCNIVVILRKCGVETSRSGSSPEDEKGSATTELDA